MFTLHSLDDADRFRQYIVSDSVKRVVIVGGGYVGVEVSEALRRLEREVIVVDHHEHLLWHMLDRDVAEHVERTLVESGVELVMGKHAVSLEGRDGKARRSILEGGEVVEGDAFPLAMGVRPCIELAERVGARLGVTGAIWVDERMRTSVNDVYAVGDCVETRDLVAGEPVRMPFAPTANKMGYVAGTNVAGRDAKFPGRGQNQCHSIYGHHSSGHGAHGEGGAEKSI